VSKKPDGSPARTERVTFTKPAAERIAKVVRAVEGGDRDCGPLTFGARVGGGGGTTIKLARYTSTNSWLKGTAQQVLFVTANTATVAITGQTATAWNAFAIVSGHTGSTNNTTAGVLVSLTKIQGLWWLTNAEV
jgi:hypothetical protein